MAIKNQINPYGDISCDFSESKLAEICLPKVGVQTGPFGSQLHNEDYVESGTPIITVEHLGENRIIHENTPFVSDEDRIRLKKYSLKCGDIVFSRVGSVDRRALVRKAEDGWLFSGRCLRVRVNREVIDPVYLSYFFGLDSFKEYIRSIAVGATMPSLNTKILSDIPIYYPPLPEQHAIARILSSLDDKIELNRKMNATLEAMAQALFRSWFVDFDPVRAKAEGRDPAGMDAETAALFPDGFEVVDGKEVPVGWSVGTLSSVADILSGGTPKTSVSEYWDGDVPWVTAKDVTNNSGGFIINTERKITDRGVSESSTRWLKKGTTIITARGSVGECALLGRDMTMNQTCYGLRGKDEIGSCFVYLMTINKIQELKQQSYGTIFDTITRKTFNEISVVIPPKELLKQFEDIILPLFQSILKNTEQSRTLAALRDTLLPKLISGEVRVPVDEGEKAII